MNDKEIVVTALSMFKNNIETGDTSLSARDVIKIGEENCGCAKVKALSTEQMKIVIRITELIEHITSKW